MWRAITNRSEVPSDCDLRLAVINREGVHALVFPCRKSDSGWVHARNRRLVEVYPTHWQQWSDDQEPRAEAH